MARIIDAKPARNHVLYVRFADGAEGHVDLSHIVATGVFRDWADPAFFDRVSVNPQSGTVEWPGGIDLCPDVLYHKLTGAPLPGGRNTNNGADQSAPVRGKERSETPPHA